MKNDSQINCRLPYSIKLQVERIALEHEVSVSQWLLDLIMLKLNEVKGVDNSVDKVYTDSVDNSVDKVYTSTLTTKLVDRVNDLKQDNTDLREQIIELTKTIENLALRIDNHEFRLNELPKKPKRGRPRKIVEPIVEETAETKQDDPAV